MHKKNSNTKEKEYSIIDKLGIEDARGTQLTSDTVDCCKEWIESDETLGIHDLIKMVQEKAKPETALEGVFCGYVMTKTLEVKRSPIAMLEMLMR